MGDTINAEVRADYYFGAPVADAAVEYYVTREPAYYFGDNTTDDWDADLPSTPGSDSMVWNDYGYGEGEVVISGKGRTNDAGSLQLSLPSIVAEEQQEKPAQGFAEDETQNWQYVIHATVTDASKRSEDGTADTLVTQGDLYLESYPADYLVPRERRRTSLSRRVTTTDTSCPISAAQRSWCGSPGITIMNSALAWAR